MMSNNSIMTSISPHNSHTNSTTTTTNNDNNNRTMSSSPSTTCSAVSSPTSTSPQQRPLSELFIVERSMMAQTIYGKLMRCRCKETHAQVAVKVYDRSRASRHLTRAGFRVLEDADMELSLLRLLRNRPHPHLVSEHASAAHLQPGTAVDYAVMPFADGGDMLSYLRATDVSTAVAARHFVRIMCAVRHLHRLGYAHRDLSLENILLVSESGADKASRCSVDMGVRAVLGDYGLAVELGPQPAPTTCRPGKPGYMAPEIFNYKPYDAAAADIFSAGVVLFGLLARALPYHTPTSSDVAFNMIQTGRLADLLEAWSLTSRFANGAVELVAAMLHRDPARRPTIDEVLAHPWCAAAVEECVDVMNAGVGSPTSTTTPEDDSQSVTDSSSATTGDSTGDDAKSEETKDTTTTTTTTTTPSTIVCDSDGDDGSTTTTSDSKVTHDTKVAVGVTGPASGAGCGAGCELNLNRDTSAVSGLSSPAEETGDCVCDTSADLSDASDFMAHDDGVHSTSSAGAVAVAERRRRAADETGAGTAPVTSSAKQPHGSGSGAVDNNHHDDAAASSSSELGARKASDEGDSGQQQVQVEAVTNKLNNLTVGAGTPSAQQQQQQQQQKHQPASHQHVVATSPIVS